MKLIPSQHADIDNLFLGLQFVICNDMLISSLASSSYLKLLHGFIWLPNVK